MTPSLRAKALTHTDAPRPAPGSLLPTPTGGRPRKTERPQRFPHRETHPITIMSPTFSWSRTEISLGARAHDEPNRLTTRNHSPPSSHGQSDPHLTGGPCTESRLRLVLHASGARSAVTDELTAREQAVLLLLPGGLSAREIGSELGISRDTIKTHTKSIYRKLGASSRRDAVVRARELGLL